MMTRRRLLAGTATLTAMAGVAILARPAWATVEATEAAIGAFTGGKTPEPGRITLTAPEIAENGNSVPVTVEVDSPMTEGDYVASVTILADGNPNPEVATFHFTPLSGTAAATTRIRLAKTQNVVAIAKMSDGSTFSDRKEVKVTIGGCGG
ncbi:thiosulfate oxidation carrier protein SoxY [Jiella pelagia]